MLDNLIHDSPVAPLGLRGIGLPMCYTPIAPLGLMKKLRKTREETKHRSVFPTIYAYCAELMGLRLTVNLNSSILLGVVGRF